MAWTTPTTVNPGDAILASLWNTQVKDNLLEFAPLFAAWTSYTPQIDQGATTNITKTVSYARYLKVGRLAIVQFRLDVTGSGTAGSAVTVTLPSAVVPVGAGASGNTFGFCQIYDSSTAINYGGQIRPTTTTQMSFSGDWSAANFWGVAPNLAVANADQIHGTLICETTS